MIVRPKSRTAEAAGRGRPRISERGALLVEAAIGVGLVAVVALIVMKASLLAISNNQWTIMQTLTDAYLTRETALSNRVPVAEITGVNTLWPDAEAAAPPEQTVTLGKVAGGQTISGTLRRFRVDETPAGEVDTTLSVWRLHSVLTYKIAGKDYMKTRTTLRMQ